MIDRLDEIDNAMVDRTKTTECRSIRDVIRPFLLEKSEAVLRTRIKYLELHGYIRTEKTTHGRVRCFPNENRNASVTSTGKQNTRQNTQAANSGVQEHQARQARSPMICTL